jgi:hypothetical protein
MGQLPDLNTCATADATLLTLLLEPSPRQFSQVQPQAGHQQVASLHDS